MESQDPAVGPLVELTFLEQFDLIPAVGLIPLTITNGPDDSLSFGKPQKLRENNNNNRAAAEEEEEVEFGIGNSN